MGLLQENKAIFYHPLNDLWEYDHPTNAWTKSSGSLAAGGKVSRALSREDITAGVSGDTGVYSSAAAATKVAFCGWFRSPSDVPSQTAAPTTDSPIADAATSCSGTGVNGAAVEVFIDDVSDGSADGVVSGGVWSKTDLTAVSAGEVVSARQRSAGELQSDESNEVTVLAYSAAPTVDSPIYDGATSASGTSAEADGTVIQVYVGGTPHGSTTTVSSGTWTQSGLSLSSGNQVKARATASGKLQSVDSNTVTVAALLGSQKQVGGQTARGVDVGMLDSDTSVVAYTESSIIRCRIVTVSGSDATLGAEYTAFTANRKPRLAVLDSTTFVIAGQADDSWKVGTVNGNDITFGSSYGAPINSYYDDYKHSLAVTKLTSTKFAAHAYGYSGGGVYIGLVSGTSITFGSNNSCAGGDHIDICALDSTKIVVARSTTNYGYSIAGLVTGLTVSFGSQVAHAPYTGSADKICAALARIDSGEFIVCWHESSGYFVRRCTVTGLTISTGASATVSNAAGHNGASRITATEVFDTGKFIVTYLINRNNLDGETRIGDTGAGSGINLDSAVIHKTYGPRDIWDGAAALTSSTALIMYATAPSSNPSSAVKVRVIT